MPIAGWAFPTAKWKAGSPRAGLQTRRQRNHRAAHRRRRKSSPSSSGWPPPKARPNQRGGMSLEGSHRRWTARFRCRSNSRRPRRTRRKPQLWTAIRRLEPLQPHFVSVTYGAGGSTRERTHATVKRIVEETSLKPAAHLTCVGASRGEIDEIVRGYWDAGIRHIVALRGDMPGMDGPYRAASRRLSLHAGTDRGHPPHRAVRGQRVLLSRAPSGFAQPWP